MYRKLRKGFVKRGKDKMEPIGYVICIVILVIGWVFCSRLGG